MIHLNKMFFKRNWPYIFMFSAFFMLLLMYLFRQFAMLNTTETCGKVTQEIVIKGNHSFMVSFYVGDEKKVGGVSSQAITTKCDSH